MLASSYIDDSIGPYHDVNNPSGYPVEKITDVKSECYFPINYETDIIELTSTPCKMKERKAHVSASDLTTPVT